MPGTAGGERGTGKRRPGILQKLRCEVGTRCQVLSELRDKGIRFNSRVFKITEIMLLMKVSVLRQNSLKLFDDRKQLFSVTTNYGKVPEGK